VALMSQRRDLTRFGMIGAGWMGDMIAPDFAQCESVELVALGARDVSTATPWAAERGIHTVVSVDDLLARDDIDVVYIATTHESHTELALRVIEAGKGVLVEKAFTTTLAEAQQIVDAARAAGVFLMEAMWTRFNPGIRAVQRLIAEGAIGDPRTVIASFGFPLPRIDHRLWDPARAGGSLLDQGVYPLTIAQLVFSEPLTVAATGSRLAYGGEVTDVDSELGMLLGYEGGQQAVLATSIRTQLPLSASIGGDAGLIEIGEAFWSDTTYTLRTPDGSRETRTEPKEGNGYVPMLRAVHEALSNGWLEHPLCTLDDSLALMRTVDRVRAALG
jgi:predicted dehydrogenase